MLFIYVPAGKTVEESIHVGNLVPPSDDAGAYAWHRRCLVVLGPNSKAAVVESFAGPRQAYLTNAVTEVVVGDNAELDHYKVQEEGDAAFHMALTQVQLGRAARFSSHAFSLGGRLVAQRDQRRLHRRGRGMHAQRPVPRRRPAVPRQPHVHRPRLPELRQP